MRHVGLPEERSELLDEQRAPVRASYSLEGLVANEPAIVPSPALKRNRTLALALLGAAVLQGGRSRGVEVHRRGRAQPQDASTETFR